MRGQWLYVISWCAIWRQWPDTAIAQVTLMLLGAATHACLASRCGQGDGQWCDASGAVGGGRKEPLRMRGFGAVHNVSPDFSRTNTLSCTSKSFHNFLCILARARHRPWKNLTRASLGSMRLLMRPCWTLNVRKQVEHDLTILTVFVIIQSEICL